MTEESTNLCHIKVDVEIVEEKTENSKKVLNTFNWVVQKGSNLNFPPTLLVQCLK